MIRLSKLYTLFFTLLLCLPLVCSATETQPENPTDIASRLQQRYNGIKSLSFNFFQQTRGEMTGRPKSGSGKAFFYKGDGKGRMRWDYSSPDRQVLVSDGENFSMYFSNLKQMIVTPADTLDTELTYAFFIGKGNLVEDFHILPEENESVPEGVLDMKIIKLVPRTPQSQVQDIDLWITDDSLIRRMQIRDHFGTITVLNFSDIVVDSLEKMTPQERDALFEFQPPKGTEIIHQ